MSLGISLPVLQWLLSTFQSCSELPVPGALGFPRTLFSSVVNTAGGLAGSQRDLEISVMCDQGLNPSSMWSQPVQGRQGVLNSSWSSSVQRWSSVSTNRDHSAPTEHRTLFACFPDFFQIPTVEFWESETSLPVFISCLHLLSPHLPTSGTVSLPCPPAARRRRSRFPPSSGITSALNRTSPPLPAPCQTPTDHPGEAGLFNSSLLALVGVCTLEDVPAFLLMSFYFFPHRRDVSMITNKSPSQSQDCWMGTWNVSWKQNELVLSLKMQPKKVKRWSLAFYCSLCIAWHYIMNWNVSNKLCFVFTHVVVRWMLCSVEYQGNNFWHAN